MSRGPGTFRQRNLTEPPPPRGVPHHRTIFAVDIESSTTRPNPVKAELRRTLYELTDAALCSAGICERHRDPFFDHGDGVLAYPPGRTSVRGATPEPCHYPLSTSS